MTASLVDHAAAFLALLRASADLTVYPETTGGVKLVPDGAAPPYVAVRIAADRPLGHSLIMASSRLRMRAYCYCVGSNDEAARIVSDLVAKAVLGVRVSVAGRECFPIRHETDHSREPVGDESTNTLVCTLTDVYRLDSVPGRTGS